MGKEKINILLAFILLAIVAHLYAKSIDNKLIILNQSMDIEVQRKIGHIDATNAELSKLSKISPEIGQYITLIKSKINKIDSVHEGDKFKKIR